MHAGVIAQLLPPVIALIGGGAITPPRRWLMVWCLLLVTNAAISLALGFHHINNLWVGYVFMPVTGAVALWALSFWHPPGTARLTLRVAVPLFVTVSVALTLGVDDASTFSLTSAPFHGLVLLLAAAWTFIQRSLRDTGALLRRDWFWMLGGFMLYAGTATALEPASAYLMAADRPDLVFLVINAKAAADILAFATISWGVLCPVPPTFSGGSSSLPSLRSGSSSAPSASPW